jgi:hypothetical protein
MTKYWTKAVVGRLRGEEDDMSRESGGESTEALAVAESAPWL